MIDYDERLNNIVLRKFAIDLAIDSLSAEEKVYVNARLESLTKKDEDYEED